eukprot:TRINITY_DN77222_c0_g1_i1.p2 TRINITY_DN77222_c0_g1~~TRINITY_DN77222_c0_g1_i1.p2  ORF type:complete len:124 (-),score=28.22 TRINITY_DN77222_c0_g1_i1:213-584(-)
MEMILSQLLCAAMGVLVGYLLGLLQQRRQETARAPVETAVLGERARGDAPDVQQSTGELSSSPGLPEQPPPAPMPLSLGFDTDLFSSGGKIHFRQSCCSRNGLGGHKQTRFCSHCWIWKCKTD